LLLGWIHSSLTESIQAQVISCTSTVGLWTHIQQSFSSSSRAQLNDLYRQLQTTTKCSTSFIEYLQKIRKISDEISFIGSPVSDDDLTLAVLSNLGSDYNSFYAAITTTSRSNPISFADLHRLLLSHEALLQYQYTAVVVLNTPSSTAFLNRPTK
jgi:gag-polypeptide of LTR copia-type